MSLAIHYTSIKPPTEQSREVFGLQVAIADWLRAYFRYARAEKFTFLIGDKVEQQDIHQFVREVGIDASRLALLDRRFPEQNFKGITTIFRPEPDTRRLLWQRNAQNNFSFCGLAHAISGVEAGEVLQDYYLSPSRGSDAIVCPSYAVKAAITAFWDHYADYMRARFRADFYCPVQLPVIPLGIDIEKFERRVTADKRCSQRTQLGIGDADIVLLWVGRLSAAIKAHPLAMFQAAERAAQKTGAKIHLVMVGYFVPDEAEVQFKKLANDFCNKVTVHFIAANDARFADGLWAAGDIFLSLVDNCQESFGLTPIEAMAAGLPRVISDWDGYRDSVSDGEDGFLIRTTQLPPGMGGNLVAQVLCDQEVYGGFLAKTALTTSVDTDQAADRIARLIVDKNLRASMADKARVRARASYDWSKIIPAYEDLWADLAARRETVTDNIAYPLLPDPYTMYAAYPSRILNEADMIGLTVSVEQIQKLWSHEVNCYANDTMLAAGEITALIGWLGSAGAVQIATLLRQFPAFDRPRLWRSLGWMQKLGIIKNSPCPATNRA